MKKILAVLLSTSIMLAGTGAAQARDHDRNGRDNRWDNHNSRSYDRHDNYRGHGSHNNGAGLALGIFAGVTALALASNAYSQPVYVQPEPVYVAPRPVYVQQTYRPVTVARTVYRTEYRPVRYAEVW